MTIRLYNSLTKKKEKLIPYQKGKIGMYVCGPTVYGPSHLGHARTYIAFDVIRRFLEYEGFDVTFICNITDVHDDMIKKANELGITIFALGEKYFQEYLADMESLKVKEASVYPKVTDNIEGIISMISTLIAKGYAYQGQDQSVYFDVSEFTDYGKLSGIKLEEGKTGTRVDTDKYEREEASDFVLWKARKGKEVFWDSPWGPGRPGWHIECSVMSQRYLGETVDIHGGAIDLIFPHHENEIAQSEASTGKDFVRYWLHSGLLRIEGEKMSKSLGNFIVIPELLNQYDPLVIRFFLLLRHYRSSVDFTHKGVAETKKRLKRWHNKIRKLSAVTGNKVGEVLPDQRKTFLQAMRDDFNVPETISLLEGLFSDSSLPREALLATLLDFDQVLQLGFKEVFKENYTLDPRIKKLIEEREKARREKDWGKADALREKLANENIGLKDTSEGVDWFLIE